jgi:hypothetical protein
MVEVVVAAVFPLGHAAVGATLRLELYGPDVLDHFRQLMWRRGAT